MKLSANMSKEDFYIEELRELYNKRWEIELRIRDLKYNIGLNMLHSRIKNSVKQKHEQRLNFSICVQVCKAMLRGECTAESVC